MPDPTPPTAPDRLTRLAETVHLSALAIWLGAVVLSGVVAAVIFPLMRELEPTLGAYPLFEGDHANLAAGRIAAQIFLLADLAQFGMAFVALVALAVLIVRGAISNRRLGHGIRVVTMAVALTTLSYHLLLLGPRMDKNLNAYWTAAEVGDNLAAENARLDFSEDHPTASKSLGLLAISVGLGLVTGLWTVQVPHRRVRTPATPRGASDAQA